jgi:hypothetical protein
MSRKFSWRVLGWPVLSLLLFGLAGALTWRITSVEGSLPLPDESRGLGGYFGPQIEFSVYAQKTTDGVHAEYIYYEGPDLSPRFIVDYDAGSPIKIVINNLMTPNSCVGPKYAWKSPPSYAWESPKPGDGVSIEKISEISISQTAPSALYVVTPGMAPSDGLAQTQQPSRIVCDLKSTADLRTFTTKALHLDYLFYTEASDLFRQDDQELHETQKRVSASVANFTPVKQIAVNFVIEGASHIDFDGGTEVQGSLQKRLLEANSTSLSIAWTDEIREQFRDIMLIIIGTLIALGATTLIEALRPIFRVRPLED